MKPSLLNAPAELFSPLYVNSDLFDSDKAAALYKFSSIFFPQLGPAVLNLLLDMEKHCRKVIAAVAPEERKRLIRELEGVTVEMHYIIKERGREMMKLPIKISPVDVLKNTISGKAPHRYSEKMQKEISAIIVSLVDKEIQKRVGGMIEGFIKKLMIKPRMPALLKELFDRGLINREGRLAEGTTIMDLVSGRYARLFKRVVPEELVNEAMLLRKTINICYDWRGRGEDYQSLANEALRERGILEVTLGEIRKKKGEK
ncbi:MAG: hypothetical protein NTX71_09215 [Candidatus Aureabacteria bacterium]|nr:hypothetical protein [Candidatus Auribacterota bacterium]